MVQMWHDSGILIKSWQIGTYVGMSTFIVGFAGLAGTPITGAMIDHYHGYSEGIIFSASVIMVGALISKFFESFGHQLYTAMSRVINSDFAFIVHWPGDILQPTT